ncbi:MAG TPA: biotin carboxylase N-terminal domain-containing protein [Candidatus Limnocylindrales bacterium]|nr:biotin carboxylase N-terminal domain-containing protein [Candidatus Limnocylindrales bacterium]
MTEELSPRAAAERVGATTRSVQRWIATGRLPARRVGGRWRVALDAVDAFVAQTGEPARGTAPIRRLFIANRGEIAARIGRTAQRLGIVAIVPQTDGPAALDLLSIDAVVAAALAAQADALHPGFGFLAENAAFAEAVEAAGIRWVGPPPAAIRTMGDKAAARRLAASLGIPIVPGYDGADQSDAALARAARRIGLPLLVKPAAGGGGKGMRVVREPGRLTDALAAARREAAAAFGDERLILERLVEGPRHVEVQVLFDGHGAGVHLGERDCSIQRRNQKVLEETPSPGVDPSTRRRLADAALALAGAVGYRSAGTCEFLLDDAGEIHFLEMNTRLQVEHPVTELVTGRDLVADQLRIAAGEPLRFGQADVRLRGHAFEVRLYAEDAETGFLPATGTVEALRWPTGQGVRVDAGVEVGTVVGGRFDPLLAKIVAHGGDREEALDRLAAALDDTLVLGLTTNLRFLRWLVRQPAVRDGEARIDTLERIWPPDARPAPDEPPDEVWRIAAAVLGGGWRLNADPVVRVSAGEAVRTVAAAGHAADTDRPAFAIGHRGESVHVDVDGRSVELRRAPPPDVDAAARAAAAHGHVSGAAEIVAPMPGSVVALHAAVGDRLEAGAPIVTLEAMKMEHAVASPIDARLVELLVGPGDQVARGQLLAVLEA